ncbi:hypothetical protein [Nocardioides sp. Soil805]|uniref:hypothetical protein n=1 Tax=Nocardioides sp. Soil805 TaxID=1736416 RepID=UPI000702BA2E|nr:hypothetical protein [Nocardioides sp. Soil805]KRF35165.1 hypothetical protein ASG94_13685 [Nocardioides sp. Soil805]
MRTIRGTAGLAATVLTGALLLAGCGQGVDGPDPSTEVTPVTSDGGSVTSLEAAPTGEGVRCAVPSVESLRAQDTAFEGTVTEVGDGTATLDVDRWYAGDEETDQVRVSSSSREIVDLLLAVDFQEGGTYLVSATDGEVSLCGLSAAKDELLSGLYDEAFAG